MEHGDTCSTLLFHVTSLKLVESGQWSGRTSKKVKTDSSIRVFPKIVVPPNHQFQ